MKSQEINIYDVAKAAGFSTSTVSRALNNHAKISDSTKQKVREVATKLGYEPNAIASSLMTKKSKIIGVIIPRIDRLFFAEVINGMETAAFEYGYSTILCQSQDLYEREVANAKTLLSTRVAGVIASVAMETQKYEHFQRFVDKEIPLVFFDRVCYEIETTRLLVDDFDSAYKSTEHLISQGCKRIAHLGGPLHMDIYQKRSGGYRQALADYNIVLDENLIMHDELTRENGHRIAAKFLNAEIPPDGIFAANNITAISMITYAKNNGFKIPENLAILGFGEESFSDQIDPPVSSVRQPSFEMGKKAVEKLIEEIDFEGETYQHETVVMPTQLIARRSSLRY